MLTRRVIAADITNLTDARYFAARGVDYLMFDMAKVALDRIIEIKDWVEGPELILSLDSSSLNLIEEAILKVKPFAVVSKNPQTTGELMPYQAHVEVTEFDNNALALDDKKYVPVGDLSVLDNLEEEHGIIISGSDEVEVGVKDYDLLDGILDLLEEEEI